jgi:[pyruvate, water dikinase]-phosphate phosphotransferase / [pyruvate, water dikinase] kinase
MSEITPAEAPRRTVFFISDGTGITAETLGHALLTQFATQKLRQVPLPFVNSESAMDAALDRMAQAMREDGARPVVFSTLVDQKMQARLDNSNVMVMDLLGAFLKPLELEFGQKSTLALGRSHAIADRQHYHIRMEAVNYALQHDDGATVRHYQEADVILTGVSRSGKTPTCLYLAMQFGIKAANYPITEEDLEATGLPNALRPHQSRLFGLTIEPEQLCHIRGERRPNSRYSSFSQCQSEVEETERLFRKHRIPFLDTTSVSIEEISSKLMQTMALERQLY